MARSGSEEVLRKGHDAPGHWKSGAGVCGVCGVVREVGVGAGVGVLRINVLRLASIDGGLVKGECGERDVGC